MSELEDYLQNKEGEFKDIDFELTLGAILSTTVLFASSGVSWLDTISNVLAIFFLCLVGVRQISLKSVSANRERILKRSMIGVEILGLFLLMYLFLSPTKLVVDILAEYGYTINPMLIFSLIFTSGILAMFVFFEVVFKDLAIFWSLKFREATDNPLAKPFFVIFSNFILSISFSPYREEYLETGESQDSVSDRLSSVVVTAIASIFLGCIVIISYLALWNIVSAILTVFVSFIGMGFIQIIYYLYGYSSFDSLNGDFTRGKITLISIVIGLIYFQIVTSYLV
jgi:hypothetical protein